MARIRKENPATYGGRRNDGNRRYGNNRRNNGNGNGNDDRNMRDFPPLPEKFHKLIAELLKDALSPEANAGLVFWRYPKVWRNNRLVEGREYGKWLKSFVRDYSGQKTEQEWLLRSLLERYETLGEGRTFLPTGPVVTGLGADHPTNNGFSFHAVLGIPWLPGSSVKGLCRAGAILLDGQESRRVRDLLGFATDTAGGTQSTASRGKVVFLGALPTAWPKLHVDIVNPHYPEYYQDQSKERPGARKGQSKGNIRTKIPSPIEDPVPSPFLVVSPETQFRFWLREVPGASLAKEDWEQVWEWLEAGLDYLGIGAKTAAGYGHMTRETAGQSK